ncbi:MAG: PilZ domain-containing protein [Oscillibacter sp.]|nr:PilZ domain-containing protein [Oscillibacter sp.]
MGLFSFLFDRNDYTYVPPPKKEEKPEGFPDLYNNMNLDVFQKDGRPFLTGRLTAFTAKSMTIERLPGWLSFELCDPGKTVIVHGFTKKMVPFSISAVIQESTRTACKLKDLSVQTHDEHRETFRLPVNAPASLFYQHDTRCENPEECVLVDISTGGACVQSEFLHAEGEVLRMKCQIEDYVPMNFLGQVIRVTEHSPGKFRYGLLFAQLNEDEMTTLTRTLYNIQVGNRSEWRRTEAGHW